MNIILDYLINHLDSLNNYESEYKELRKKAEPLASKSSDELTKEESEELNRLFIRISELSLLKLLIKGKQKHEEIKKGNIKVLC